jgi:hypothetical protein
MELIKIDVIRPKPAQAFFALSDQMVPRGAAFVRAIANNHSGFGRNEHIIPATFQNLAENFLRDSVGITIGGIEQVDTRLEAEIDLVTRGRNIRGAYLAKNVTATESHRT